MIPSSSLALAEQVLAECRRRALRIATAESCTGGLIAACLTAVPGSSEVVERGFVTYTNESKSQLLGVPESLLMSHGAVSEATARAMAEGAVAFSRADASVAVTGIAGPGGATAIKPVGLVHIAAARTGFAVRHQRYVFDGDRAAVRLQAVDAALTLLLSLVSDDLAAD